MTLTYTRASPGREALHETVTLSFPRILEELLQSGLEIEIPATLSVWVFSSYQFLPRDMSCHPQEEGGH